MASQRKASPDPVLEAQQQEKAGGEIRAATPKAPKVKEQFQLGDGEPKKKPTSTPSQKRNNKRKRVAAFERLWSRASELRILRAMASYTNTHRSTLPDTCDLFAALASNFNRRDALADKVQKLKRGMTMHAYNSTALLTTMVCVDCWIAEQHLVDLINTMVVSPRATPEPGGSIAPDGGGGEA
uniref:Glabrous enhancer-binding protein-like DBD domain-containing protein n=1 Tax=Oryza nivara TaxID=4536 RepID=A0A0E0FUL6_ORYNI